MGVSYLESVRLASQKQLEKLKAKLAPTDDLMGGDGTVYATGSYGRLEAGPQSDLDVFIVSLNNEGEARVAAKIDGIRQIMIKNNLIVAARESELPDFDAGGKFLETHLYKDIVSEIGSPSDDFKNTFTGRMLLILESQPIIGCDIYNKLRMDSVNSYFADFSGNESDFVPYFLVNDILRMWRTFCVNYEYFNNSENRGSSWRVKNLKLKYTRMLTCYSALIYILLIYKLYGTVTPDDVIEMSKITPIQRVSDFINSEQFKFLENINNIKELSNNIVSDYGEFLEFVQTDDNLIRSVKEDEESWRRKSHDFGGHVARMLEAIGGDDAMSNRLFRSILV